MAQVVYTGISDGDSRGAARVNDILAPFETQSTNVSKENFRDEGLDTRVLKNTNGTVGAGGTVTSLAPISFYDGVGEAFVNNAWTTILFSTGDAMQIDTVTLYEGRSLRVRFSCEFRVEHGGAGGESEQLSFALYQTIGGVSTIVPVTIADFVGQHEIFLDWYGNNHMSLNYYRDSVTITYLFKGTETGLHIENVQARAMIAAGAYELRCCSIHGTYFWR